VSFETVNFRCPQKRQKKRTIQILQRKVGNGIEIPSATWPFAVVKNKQTEKTEPMKINKNHTFAVLAAVGFTLATMSALGQTHVISSFGQNGQLVCGNLEPGSTASVEWASSVLGPWSNNWTGLESVTADSNGMIRVSVPMFYRVRGTPVPPLGMALIPAGSFTMGDTFNDGVGGSGSPALPLHTVHVSTFYVDKYEVTKALWDEVRRWSATNGYSFNNPGSGKAANHPVQTVSWYDVVKWCNARSQKEGRTPAYYTDAELIQVYKTGQRAPYVDWNAGYRLPTEAEWEKAARGGTSGHRFSWSDVETISHSQANYQSEGLDAYDISPTRGFHPTFNVGALPYTSPVGYFAENGYGLYDMTGNVFEWCWDRNGAYSSDSQTDPRGSASGSYRALRGGSFGSTDGRYRVAYRNFINTPDATYNSVGFRSVLAPGQP
jgi:formylglycine-generating enzyme